MRTAVRAAPVLFILAILFSSQTVDAAVQTTAGQSDLIGNTLPEGTTSYDVLYTYPSAAQVGTNLTISLTLHVNAFTGQLEYIAGYGLEAQLFIGAQELQSSNFGPAGFNSSSYLYPGGYWGPSNFTFPLTVNNTGVTRGTSTNATLRITLRDTVYYGVPAVGYETEPAMEVSGGSLLIQNAVPSNSSTTSFSTTTSASGGQAVLPYALLGSGVVLMVAAAFLPRFARSPQANKR